MNGRDAEEYDSGYGESSQYAAHLDRGWALLDRGDLSAARTSVSHAQDVRPDDPDASVLQGAIALAEGNAEESLKCYERALELDPDYLEPYAAAAQICLFDLDDPDRALHFCSEALELDVLDAVESVDLNLLAAECELAQNRPRAARRRLAGCAELAFIGSALELAAGLWSAEDTNGEARRELAVRVLERDMDGEPLDDDDRKDRLARVFQLALRTARLTLDIGDTDKTVVSLRAVTEMFPNEADAWYLLSEAYLRAGDVRRGAEASLRTLELDAQIELASWIPNPAEIHQRVLAALGRLGDERIRTAIDDDTPVGLLIQERPSPELIAEGIDPRILTMALGARPSSAAPDAPLILTAVSVYRANIARLCRNLETFDEELRLALADELEAFFTGPPAPAEPVAPPPQAAAEPASDASEAGDKSRRRKRRRSRKS